MTVYVASLQRYIKRAKSDPRKLPTVRSAEHIGYLIQKRAYIGDLDDEGDIDDSSMISLTLESEVDEKVVD